MYLEEAEARNDRHQSVQWVLEVLSAEVNKPAHEANHLPTFIGDMNNASPFPAGVFMVWYLINLRYNFTFYRLVYFKVSEVQKMGRPHLQRNGKHFPTHV
jgi:hypothetical protein